MTKIRSAWTERFSTWYCINFILEDIPSNAWSYQCRFDSGDAGLILVSGRAESDWLFFGAHPLAYMNAREILVNLHDIDGNLIETASYPNSLPMMADGQYYDRSQDRFRFFDKSVR